MVSLAVDKLNHLQKLYTKEKKTSKTFGPSDAEYGSNLQHFAKQNSKTTPFLGFMPNTTKNIIWFDLDTERVKIAKHAKFDEGMNDLPITELPPNTTYLQRSELRQPFPEDKYDLTTSDFDFVTSPFVKHLQKQ